MEALRNFSKALAILIEVSTGTPQYSFYFKHWNERSISWKKVSKKGLFILCEMTWFLAFSSMMATQVLLFHLSRNLHERIGYSGMVKIADMVLVLVWAFVSLFIARKILLRFWRNSPIMKNSICLRGN